MRRLVAVLTHLIFAGYPADPLVLNPRLYNDLFEIMEYIFGRMYFTVGPRDHRPREDAGNQDLINIALDLNSILAAAEGTNGLQVKDILRRLEN